MITFQYETDEEETPSSSSDVSQHSGTGSVETPPSPPEINANESLKLQQTRLSSREMFRLSERVSADWYKLAGEMNIPKEKRYDIQNNVIYTDNRSRAEKILSIFNNKREFSRKKLAGVLRAANMLDLILPVLNGEWRSVRIDRANHENTGT